MKKNGTGGETHINMVSYGGGVNSTALLIGLHQHRIPVDLILFADTGAEHPHTYAYLDINHGPLAEGPRDAAHYQGV